jgi:hypothetical protein
MNPEDGGSDLGRSVGNYLPFDSVMTAKCSVIACTTVLGKSFDQKGTRGNLNFW